MGTILAVKAQDLNNYKYVIIPETYEFTGDIDQYQLNSLTKYLFEQEGFTTLMKSEDKPEDLRANSCLGLKVNVKDDSGLFVTKLFIELEDCYGKLVFESKEGRSRKKEFKEAYHEAIRDAFSEIEEMEYEYEPVSSPIAEKPADKQVEKPQIETKEEAEPIVLVEKGMDEAPPVKNIEDSKVEADKTQTYRYSDKNFELRKTNQGLGLYQEGATEPIAILIETDGGQSYIYNSLTNQGVAYFDAENNFVVEYYDRQEDKKVKIRYELNSQ